jgi:hypothetical protein
VEMAATAIMSMGCKARLRQELARVVPQPELIEDPQALAETLTKVVAALNAPGEECDVPLDMQGSDAAASSGCMMAARGSAATSSWRGTASGEASIDTSRIPCRTSSKSCEPPSTRGSCPSRTPDTSGWANRRAFRSITLTVPIQHGEAWASS